MRFVLSFTALIFATGTLAHGSAAAEHAPVAPHTPMVGGWSDADVSKADVRDAAHAALRKLPVKHAKLRRIEAAQTQVVAGVNYHLTLKLTNGSHWRATVWRKLDGTYEVSDAARVK